MFTIIIIISVGHNIIFFIIARCYDNHSALLMHIVNAHNVLGAGLLIIARCYDNHSALMHITSSGLGYSTQPPLRHGDHDHHDEMEAGLDFYAGTIA